MVRENSTAASSKMSKNFHCLGNEHVIMQKDDCLPFSRLRHSLPCVSLTDTGGAPCRVYMFINL